MIRGLLLDLEGVLYDSVHIIPGAADAVRELADAGLKIRYLTNTTTRSRRAIVERLQSIGVFIDPQHLFTPSAAAGRLLERDGIRQLHLAAPSALREDLGSFELVEANPEAVVMGDLHEGFTWRRLNQLFQMVRSGARLVALHRNRYCRRECGISLDLGPFVAALEYAADIRADVVGKPARAFFDLALADLGLDAEEVVMVGTTSKPTSVAPSTLACVPFRSRPANTPRAIASTRRFVPISSSPQRLHCRLQLA